MATDLQKRALESLVEASRTKKRVLKGQVLKLAGYAPNTAIKPNQVFESKGFLDLCEEVGLTDLFLTKALVDDIKHKPRNREKELRLAFNVKGKLNEQPKGDTYNQFNFFDAEQLKRIARRVQNGDSTSTAEPDRLSNSDQS